jgi:DNA-binding Lrp family transcriptional regulator
MSFVKYIDRLRRMDFLIRSKATGNAEEFSKKLGVSISLLKEHVREMRELGAIIEFSRYFNSYVYKGDCKLILRFKENLESSNITGR